MENVKRINKYLVSTYGSALDGKPKFRVVFSNDLFEVRRGHFERYTEGGIYLGSHEGIQRAPKYTYIRDKHLLEVYTRAFPQVFGRSIVHASGIVKDGDYYEPLRVFKTKDNKYLPPNQDVCKIICDAFIELINRPEIQRITEGQVNAMSEESLLKETAKFFDILSQDDSDILSALRDKEGVSLYTKGV
jgi:hypothetical protein